MSEQRTLRQMREERSLTRAELAHELGVSLGSVYNWEFGERLPQPKHIRKLAQLYQVSPGEIKASITSYVEEGSNHEDTSTAQTAQEIVSLSKR